jgi:hypothetical protein
MPIHKNSIKRLLKWYKNCPSDQIFENLGIIFVHIPKTGGTSIRNTLHPYAPSRYSYPQIGKHALARDIRAATGHRLWNNSTSIAVIRNPWDWTVSSYHWWVQIASNHHKLIPQVQLIRRMGGFDAFVRSSFFDTHIHEFTQKDMTEWILCNGKVMVSRVLRFESLVDDWNCVVKDLSLPFPALPHENKSLHRDFRHYYTDTTASLVATKFSDCIARFGYSFDCR